MARLISRQEAATILGRSIQTVSNWVDTGILTGHFVNRQLFIDSETVYKNFDSLKELSDSTDLLNRKLAEVKLRIEGLDDKLRDLTFGELALSTGLSPVHLREFFRAMLKLSGEDTFSDRERNILNSIVDVSSVAAVSEKLDLSSSAVCYHLVRSFHKMANLQNYPAVCRENAMLTKEIERLRKENKVLSDQHDVIRYKEQHEAAKSKILYEKYGKQGIKQLSELLVSSVARKFSTRVNNLLKGMEINTFADIVCHDELFFLNSPKFGKNSVEDMKKTLSSYYLHLGMDVQTIFSLNNENNIIKL